jgi:hypothetical protein
MSLRDHNWKKVQRHVDRYKCRALTEKEFDMDPTIFTEAVVTGILVMPGDWDEVKFFNNPNHPAKGVSGRIIAALIENPRLSYQKLADELGCSGPNITYHAQRMGIHQRLDHQVNWNDVQSVLDYSKNISATAKHFRISTTSITKRFSTGELERPEGIRSNSPLSAEDVFQDHTQTGKAFPNEQVKRSLFLHDKRARRCEECKRHTRKSEPRSRLMVTYKDENRFNQQDENIVVKCIRCNEDNMSVMEVVTMAGQKIEFWKKVETYIGGNHTIAEACEKFGIGVTTIYSAFSEGKMTRPANWKKLRSRAHSEANRRRT